MDVARPIVAMNDLNVIYTNIKALFIKPGRVAVNDRK